MVLRHHSRETLPSYAARYDIKLRTADSEKQRLFGMRLLELEDQLIRLGISNYRQDLTDYRPDQESVQALRNYQTLRYAFRTSADQVFERESEKYLNGLPINE